MNTDPNDTNQFDGGAPTEEEARLIAEGVGDGTEVVDPPAEPVVAPVTPEPAPVVAEPVAALPEKPEPPKDFAAAEKALEEAYEAGDETPLTLAKKMRDLTLEQVAYQNQVAAWEQQTAAAASAMQSAEDAANAAWKAASLAFEQANAHFMSNPLRAQMMQDAIALVDKQAMAAGERLTNEQALERAYKMAAEATSYTAPAGATPESRVADALQQRRQPTPGQTLGDVPQAAVETIRANASFESLDALAIPDLELAFANMSPSQQEAYLRDAPGATANGRD